MQSMDKRQYPRYPVNYDVICENIDLPGHGRKMRLVAENASRTGMKVHFAGVLRRNDLLKLEIIKTVGSKPISCHGKVVWEKETTLVYGERIAGIHLTKIGWSETARLITNLDV